MTLNKEQIFAVNDIEGLEKVEVPEWGGHVFVKKLTAKEVDELQVMAAEFKEAGKDYNYRAANVAVATCDDNGNRLFTKDDVEALSKKWMKPINRIVEAITKLNSGDSVETKEKN